jgi:hypothetical protein
VERVEDAVWRGVLPVVSFELVTGMTAVHPVAGVVSTTARAWLKMVNRQRRADVHFTCAAITTAELIQTA